MIVRQGGLVLASLPQEVAGDVELGPCLTWWPMAWVQAAGLLSRYHALSDRYAHG
jgi:hypothetical protein